MSLGEAGAQQSFRQAGKATSGVVVRGQLTGQRAGAKNFSSIPSKFETTLFTGNKEQNGFGCRAYRFHENENDLPGPGSYESHSVPIKDDKVYSKKGLGVGFVSKAKRVASFIDTKATAFVPGPGVYEQKHSNLVTDMRNSTAQRFNQTDSTAPFKNPSKRSVTVSQDPTPGPGAYEKPGTWDNTLVEAGPTGVLAGPIQHEKVESKPGHASRKVHYKPKPYITPAPGHYGGARNVQATAYSEQHLESAPFRSGVPISSAPARLRLTKEQELSVVGGLGGPEPGPGQYEDFTTSFSISKRRMPQFCDTSLDRFGRCGNPSIAGKTASTTGKTPGPGAYHREGEREAAPISSAAFMSGSVREDRPGGVGVPGPAFYSPGGPANRKSFHLNSLQRWMPPV